MLLSSLISQNWTKNTWSLANILCREYYNAMARTVFLLPKMFLYSIWSRDHGSSILKVETTDISNACFSINYHPKDDFSSLSILTEVSFAKFLAGLFEKVYSPLPKKQLGTTLDVLYLNNKHHLKNQYGLLSFSRWNRNWFFKIVNCWVSLEIAVAREDDCNSANGFSSFSFENFSTVLTFSAGNVILLVMQLFWSFSFGNVARMTIFRNNFLSNNSY